MKIREGRVHVVGLVVLLCSSLPAPARSADDPAAHVHAAHASDQTSSADPHAAHRAAMEKPRYAVSEDRYAVPDVALVDESGQSVPLRALLESDRPVALNFIFTTCTTICPVMTATFAQMRRELGDAGDRVRLVSISIDPEYDRPSVLKEYAQRFGAGAGWTFLTGDGADVMSVLQSFDAYAGSKMNHRPLTLLHEPEAASWIRIDGLASGADLAREVKDRLLDGD